MLVAISSLPQVKFHGVAISVLNLQPDEGAYVETGQRGVPTKSRE